MRDPTTTGSATANSYVCAPRSRSRQSRAVELRIRRKHPAVQSAKLLTPPAPRAPADVAGAEPDAEVSFVTRDLAAILPRSSSPSVLPLDDVVARVREPPMERRPRTAIRSRPATDPRGPTRLCGRGHADPYAGFEARIVPENITLLPKTDS